MQITPAIFVDKETVYHVDTCDALSDATALGEIETCIWALGTDPGKRLPETHIPTP